MQTTHRAVLILLSGAAVTLLVLIGPDLAAAELSPDRSGLRLAYVDPGTGSFVIQVVVAGIIGAAVTARRYWHKIKALFGGTPPDVDIDDDE